MADNKSQTALDSSRINVHEDYELRYWTTALRVTAEQLKEVIAKVGTSVKEVRKYLNK